MSGSGNSRKDDYSDDLTFQWDCSDEASDYPVVEGENVPADTVQEAVKPPQDADMGEPGEDTGFDPYDTMSRFEPAKVRRQA